MFNARKILFSLVVLVLVVGLYSVLAFGWDDGIERVGTVICSVLNMRQSSSTSAKIVDKLPRGTKVQVFSKSGDWYRVKHGNTEGWVHGDYLKVEEVTLGVGKVNTEVLNLREKPSTSSKILGKLTKGQNLTLISRSGAWYRVKTAGGQLGWAHGDYIVRGAATVASRGTTEKAGTASANSQSAAAAETAKKLVDYAKKFLDCKYVWGGNSPEQGFDCSGFTKYVFKEFGITLPRVAADQAKKGTKVDKSQLKVGDMVFFNTGSGIIDHVGIYIGDGKFIHAESKRYGVNISKLSESFYARSYVTARRVIK